MRLTDAIAELGQPTVPHRRPRRPSRVLIEGYTRSAENPALTPGNREKRRPSPESFLVRVRAVLDALEHEDVDCLRGELASLASDCERWCDALLLSASVHEDSSVVSAQ